MDTGLPVCLMHMSGQPRSMPANPRYQAVVADVMRFLEQRVQACVGAGIEPGRLLIDPGFGFGKSLDHNLSLLANLDRFASLTPSHVQTVAVAPDLDSMRSFVLPNGLEVIAKQHGDTPFVTAALLMRGGTLSSEPAGMAEFAMIDQDARDPMRVAS